MDGSPDATGAVGTPPSLPGETWTPYTAPTQAQPQGPPSLPGETWTTYTPPAPPLTFGQRLGESLLQMAVTNRLASQQAASLAKGAAKGAGSTALNLGELATPGMTGIDIKPAETALKLRERLTPQGPQERMGFAGEQLGEFLLPIPGLSSLKIARTPGFLNLGARTLIGAGREALDIGVKTTAQTGSLEEGAKAAPMGAAFGAAGPVLESFAPFLRRSAEKEYAQVLHPGTRADKYITANKLLTPAGQDLLDRRVMGLTESGLKDRIAKNLAASTVELENAWQALGPTHQHNLMPVLDGLQQDALTAATEEVGPGQIPTPGLGNRRIVDSALYDAYQQAGLDVIERLGPRADEASAFSMRKVRQLLDQFVKKSFAGQEIPAEAMRKQAQRAATDAIRNVLNTENPTIGAVNKEYSFWRNADDVFENTNLRRVGQRRTLVKMAKGAATIAGATVGAKAGGWETSGAGAVLGGIVGSKMEAALTSTAWKTTSAVTKNEVARLLATGRGEAAADLAARAVGRTRVSGYTPSQPTQAMQQRTEPPRGENLAPALAEAIKQREGWHEGSRSQRNHNPGNLKPRPGVTLPGQTDVDKDGFAIFRDDETGHKALLNQVRVNINRGLSLNEFFGGKKGIYPGYAAARGDRPEDYAGMVAERLNIDPRIPLSSLQ